MPHSQLERSGWGCEEWGEGEVGVRCAYSVSSHLIRLTLLQELGGNLVCRGELPFFSPSSIAFTQSCFFPLPGGSAVVVRMRGQRAGGKLIILIVAGSF